MQLIRQGTWAKGLPFGAPEQSRGLARAESAHFVSCSPLGVALQVPSNRNNEVMTDQNALQPPARGRLDLFFQNLGPGLITAEARGPIRNVHALRLQNTMGRMSSISSVNSIRYSGSWPDGHPPARPVSWREPSPCWCNLLSP